MLEKLKDDGEQFLISSFSFSVYGSNWFFLLVELLKMFSLNFSELY
jgi:hypothetical protein